MEGLTEAIPREADRSKHIIEQMLYMVEINPDNVDNCCHIFKIIDKTAIPNIHCGDYFQYQPTVHFDVIITNPPYNLNGTKNVGKKRVHIDFARVSLEWLNPGGYLALICPPNYRQAGGKMNSLFRERGHFVFIKIYGAQETHKLFQIQARVDAFVFQLGADGETVINDEKGVIHHRLLDLNRHIPNFSFDVFDDLYEKVKERGCVKAYRVAELSTSKKELYVDGEFPVIHLITKKGNTVVYSNRKHSLQGVPKIIVNGLGVPYVFYDERGEYGVSQSPVVVERPSREVVEFMLSPLFQTVCNGLKITGNNNLPFLFEYVPL
jgi:hypothetical protein